MKKVALVTGAARNIGKGIATALLKEGYTCLLVDKDEAALKQALANLSSSGECYEYVADIADPKQIEGLLDWTKKKNMTVTILINNAGYESSESVAELSLPEIYKSYHVNLVGPFYLTSLLVQQWIEHKVSGNIIFTSSTHSHIIRTHPLYSSSKAAIEMFIKEASLELAEHKIRVNAVAPGPTLDTTELVSDHRVPLGFAQQPIDIGEGVCFLLSQKARFITGQTLVIDGGFSLTHTHYWSKKGRL